MRVAAFTQLSGPDGVTVQSVDDPDPSDDEVILDVEACSIGRHDLRILSGHSGAITDSELPFVSGIDVAGVVETATGSSDVEPGDRVVLCPNQTCGTCRYCRSGPENRCEELSIYHGGLAEKATGLADRLVPLPDDVSMVEAAALPGAYMTAWNMLDRADVRPGDLVLVPGATGGLGVATVQLLDVLGADSIGTSSSADKLERLADLGATYTIHAGDTTGIGEAVGELGEPDVTIDHLGGDYTRMGLRALRRGGTLIAAGYTADTTATIDNPVVIHDQKQILGHMVGTQMDLERVVTLVSRDELTPAVYRKYDLEDTAQAFETLQNRDVVGKLIIRP
jgi:D-arabinose 1-dehydrogenase-like Zn-dependent alcohol dehydrogenase